MLSNFEYIVTVNNEQKENLISILNLDANKIKIIPAFIKPTISNKNLNRKSFSVFNFNSLPKIVSSGYLFDYYGYDMILDFFEKHDEYVGIIVFYGSSNDSYKKIIMKRIEKLNNVYYFNNLSPEQFNYILTKSDIYVRNTDRDGDSVAIREASYWGLKICASNSVERPKGAELFTYNDLGEFSTAIANVLQRKNRGDIKIDGNNEQKIIDLYNSI
jgi:glycosyltransferase involved in cell wall biosynthesis